MDLQHLQDQTEIALRMSGVPDSVIGGVAHHLRLAYGLGYEAHRQEQEIIACGGWRLEDMYTAASNVGIALTAEQAQKVFDLARIQFARMGRLSWDVVEGIVLGQQS